jgi:hypothetical protein
LSEIFPLGESTREANLGEGTGAVLTEGSVPVKTVIFSDDMGRPNNSPNQTERLSSDNANE